VATTGHSIKDYSTTPGSNEPQGTNAPSVLDDSIREVAAAVRDIFISADTASASTCDIGAVDATLQRITGTTTITSFGTVSAGIWKILRFAASLTLTHNASSLILPSATNITTAAGDVGMFVSLGSGNWYCAFYSRASGLTAAAAFTFGDGTVSAPSITFTSDTNSGIYRSGADAWVLVANGVAQATINTSGLSATTITGTTVTGTNVVGSTNVRSPDIGSASGACKLTSATDTYNFDQAGGTAAKFQVDGNQFGIAGDVSSGTFIAFSIPGAVGGAEPYQFGVGSHPSSAADTGAWADVYFTALKGARIGASAAITNVLTVYAQNASTNAIYVFKDGPNPIWRVDKDGATFADGAYSGSGADYAEAFLYEGEKPAPKTPVILVGSKVRAATAEDNPYSVIGVVSEKACAIGDSGLLAQGGVPVGIVGKLRVEAGLPVHPTWKHLGDDLYFVR
jgi:hypothetical protein